MQFENKQLKDKFPFAGNESRMGKHCEYNGSRSYLAAIINSLLGVVVFLISV